jgi:hypothetical protein
MLSAKRSGLAALILLCLLTIFISSVAAEEGRLLGQTRLTRRENDVDFINFAGCENVVAIKLHALRGSAEIELLAVKYGNGAVDRLPVRQRIAQGSETRWIDLRGGRRCVRGVKIVGDTELSLDQTLIQVWGK